MDKPGMLGGWLSDLEIPPDAKLVSICTGVDDSGAQTWTIQFRAPAPPTNPFDDLPVSVGDSLPSSPSRAINAAAAAGSSGGAAPASPWSESRRSMPPPPPPLSPQQIAGGATMPIPPPLAPLAASSLASAGPSSCSSAFSIPDAPAPPAAFPVLPSQAGATNRLFPLRCAVMTYAWGKRGDGSLVGRLAAANDPEFTLEGKMPYAELWMGTHPTGPSMVLIQMPWRTITPLNEWLKLNPSMQGVKKTAALERRRNRQSGERTELPFLFKVLAVRTALSIQAHPDKLLAQRLHASRPDLYKDDNHKPEMALAVSRFEALCSFQKANHVLENCRACPELVGVVGDAAVADLAAACERAAPLTPAYAPSPAMPSAPAAAGDDAAQAAAARLEVVRPALQELFSRLMRSEAAKVRSGLDALMRRIAGTTPMLRAPVDELAVRLHEQYPGDVGVFCVYLLNYHVLQPGDGLFLGANEPHAYISGECVECMAASDNVVRSGLTPKFKDVDNLISMLTYIDGPPHLIKPKEIGPHVYRYLTPVDEFLVDRATLPINSQATLPSAPGVSIVLVLEGGGTLEEFEEEGIGAVGLQHNVEAGSIFVASANTFIRLRTRETTMAVYRACEKYGER